MKFLGQLIVLIALAAIVTKMGALLHVSFLNVPWFAALDEQGELMGWNLRAGLFVFGASLIVIGDFRSRRNG